MIAQFPAIASTQLLLSSAGLLVLLAGAMLSFVLLHTRRVEQQQLALRTAQADEHRKLLAAVVETQETERERIGQELHDGLGSSMASVKLLVDRLASQPANGPAADVLQLIERLMTHSVQDVRGIAHSLYPAVLARYGLAEAVQHLVDVTNETSPVAISLDLDYPRPLPLTQELTLYRICQELLANALRHAKGARSIAVRLHHRGGYFALQVEDDGCGFAPELKGNPCCAGLRGVEVRARLLGAALLKHSVPGNGTRMTVEVTTPAGT